MSIPLSSLVGGMLIGAAASLYWLTHGRRAGISGLFSGMLTSGDEGGARVPFLLGLTVVGLVAVWIVPGSVGTIGGASLSTVALAGMLTGFGTRVGGGCTSGHGVCGLSQFSKRSLVATLTFMFVAGVTVFIVRHGGLS